MILTDGEENHGPYDRLSIDDVEGLINEHVYAIGLGTPANIQPEKLRQLCDGHNGYMITGELNPAESDITARAVLLTDSPHSVIFGLETPDGDIISPATVHPMVEFRHWECGGDVWSFVTGTDWRE